MLSSGSVRIISGSVSSGSFAFTLIGCSSFTRVSTKKDLFPKLSADYDEDIDTFGFELFNIVVVLQAVDIILICFLMLK